MSEKEKLILAENIKRGLSKATLKMLELKMKLGEPVVISDEKGMPKVVSAKEAYEIFIKLEGMVP